MKKILSLSFCLSMVYAISAQVACFADTALYRNSAAGVYPLPYEAQVSPTGGINRAACLGRPYRFVFTVKVADSLTFGGVRLPLDSVRLATSGAIAGLPIGITYSCNPPTCNFQKNTYGCVLLTGTPTAANPLANYNLVITGTVVIQGFPISETFPGSFAPGSYTLKLVAANAPECPATTSNEDLNERFSNLSLAPNPASQNLKISFNALFDNELRFKIIDLTGKIVSTQKQMVSQGKQEIDVETALLPNGIYFLQIQQLDQTLTQKFIVQH
jgi:hypothetical protein